MPDWRQEIRRRLARLDLDAAAEADVVEEIAQHLEDQLSDARSCGADESETVRRYLDAFDVAELRSVFDERRSRRASLAPPPHEAESIGRNIVHAIRRDLAYGWHSLWRTRGATTAIILSLAIVIGANTAIFGLVDAMFLRRLPLPNAAELVAVVPESDGSPKSVSYAQYKELKASAAMPPLEAYRFEGVTATIPFAESTDLWIDLVSGGYFQLLGVKPLVGRLLDAQDERDAAPVAVVSEEFWKRHFGARQDAIGRTFKLNDMTVTLVGVTGAGFTGIQFARRFQIAMPFTISPTGFPDPSQAGAMMIARVKTPASRAAEAMSIERVFRSCCLDESSNDRQLRAQRPFRIQPVSPDDPPFAVTTTRYDAAGPGFHVLLNDASRGLTWNVDFRDRYRAVLTATMAAVLLLLLIACANISALLLARGEAREREFAVRRSLGASPSRIRMQLLIEGLELAFAGGLLGFGLAIVGTELLLRALPTSAAPLGSFIAWRTSGAVIGFSVGIMVVCAVATSLWPARRAGREELLASLTGARRHAARGLGADRVLVVAQVTLALVVGN